MGIRFVLKKSEKRRTLRNHDAVIDYLPVLKMRFKDCPAARASIRFLFGILCRPRTHMLAAKRFGLPESEQLAATTGISALQRAFVSARERSSLHRQDHPIHEVPKLAHETAPWGHFRPHP